jgi:hypothetical protein
LFPKSATFLIFSDSRFFSLTTEAISFMIFVAAFRFL